MVIDHLTERRDGGAYVAHQGLGLGNGQIADFI